MDILINQIGQAIISLILGAGLIAIFSAILTVLTAF